MSLSADSAVVLFPGAIGDFVCFLPTLARLRARHRGNLLLVAKPALLELVRLPAMATASIDRREVADLFASDTPVHSATRALFAGFGTAYSWTGFESPDVARRLTAATGGSVHVYRFRGMNRGEHAVDYYARCIGVTPEQSIDSIIADDARWFAEFAAQRQLGAFALIHPGSGSVKKNWHGFPALIRHCRKLHGVTVIALRGPAERERDMLAYGADFVAEELSLSQIAALLRRSRHYVGNDSGISHLAGAVKAPGVVLFGPSDPATWSPRSDRLRIVHAPEPCRLCGPASFCLHRLPVKTVVEALDIVPDRDLTA
jgi:heptosyltransferase III